MLTALRGPEKEQSVQLTPVPTAALGSWDRPCGRAWQPAGKAADRVHSVSAPGGQEGGHFGWLGVRGDLIGVMRT